MKLFWCAFLLISTCLSVSKKIQQIPHFRSSTELSAYVKSSIDKDLETLNLLDRAMAAPIKRHGKQNRQLRGKHQKSKASAKARNLGLFGGSSNDDETNPMIEALSSLDTKIEPEGQLISDCGRTDSADAKAAQRHQKTEQ